MVPVASLLTVAVLASLGGQKMEYLGWFTGTVEIRSTPMPGYYYLPNGYVPPKALMATTPVKVKVFDGGSVCPSLTRYQTYLYSPTPLPGYYMLPNAGRQMYPMLPTGWPFKPLSSLGYRPPDASLFLRQTLPSSLDSWSVGYKYMRGGLFGQWEVPIGMTIER